MNGTLTFSSCVVCSFQMNYMFLKRCVESRPMAPISPRWLDKVLRRVPPQLREGPGREALLQELCEEVSRAFLTHMVEHTGWSVITAVSEATFLWVMT